MKFKIAVVQFEIRQFSPDENMRRVEMFIKEASSLKSQVIVFPEDFLTGPIRGDKAFVDYDRKYAKLFQTLAKKYKIDIVTGSWIEGKKTGWYNTAYYIDSNGRIKGTYRKTNLWLGERSYLTPGNELCVFNTKYGKAGLVVCWDLAFPEIFRRMTVKGVKIIYCPSLWYLTEKGKIFMNYAENRHVDALCAARAFENEIIMVYCGAAGRIKKKNTTELAVGHSQIAAPFAGPLKKLDHNREEMFVQEIDMNILEKAEKCYRIRSDIKNRIF
ncbi:MAG: carbon-nitrogen hydrolase family protein [Candidatus Aenigmatarchaeota archaeon]